MGGARHTRVAGAWERFGWLMGAVWLVFLFFPGAALASSAAEPWAIALGWCGLVAFACAYLTGFATGMRNAIDRTHTRTAVLFWVAVACALLALPAIGWGVTSFLPFLMSYASYLLPRAWHWGATVFGILAVAIECGTAGIRGATAPWALLGIVTLIAAVNTINTWLIARSVQTDRLRLELATSEEREAIARDVHDLIGHSLTVVRMKAELASKLIDRDPEAARAELDEIARLSAEAISGVRSTVTGLRTRDLDEQLSATRAVLDSAGIRLELRGEPAMLSPAQALTAAWILREATTNVLRHSLATRVLVTIAPGTLVVEDDGVGGGAPGSGQRGMAERASAAGAVLHIERGGGTRGTRVELRW